MWASVTVQVPPASDPVTVGQVKSHLRFQHADDDALIADLISAAVALIDGPSGIGFAMMAQTWRLSLDCFPAGCITLPGAPIASVSTVNYVDPDGATQIVPSSDYVVGLASEPVRIEPVNSWPAAKSQVGAVWVDYELGVADAADVPADLVLCLKLLVAHWFYNPQAVTENAPSVVPFGVKERLQAHRRGFVVS